MASGKKRLRKPAIRGTTRDSEAALPTQPEEMVEDASLGMAQLEKLALEGIASGEPCVVDAAFWKTRHEKLAQQTTRMPSKRA